MVCLCRSRGQTGGTCATPEPPPHSVWRMLAHVLNQERGTAAFWPETLFSVAASLGNQWRG